MRSHFEEFVLGDDYKIYLDLDQIEFIQESKTDKGVYIKTKSNPNMLYITMDYEELKKLIKYTRG